MFVPWTITEAVPIRRILEHLHVRADGLDIGESSWVSYPHAREVLPYAAALEELRCSHLLRQCEPDWLRRRRDARSPRRRGERHERRRHRCGGEWLVRN